MSSRRGSGGGMSGLHSVNRVPSPRSQYDDQKLIGKKGGQLGGIELKKKKGVG